MRAVVAGSFDPITNGHMDVITRASGIFDHVVVAAGVNISKRGMFSADQRLDMIRASTAQLPNVSVQGFHGLLIDFCKRVDAGVIVRGLRAVADFDHEFMIGMANMDMAPDIQTVFLLAQPQNQFVSSSLIKEIAINGGDVTRYLPEPALHALMDKLAKG